MKGFSRFSRKYRFRGFSGRPIGHHKEALVECPESEDWVSYSTCLRCPKCRNWSGGKDDPPLCKYEYEKLKSEGYYDDQDEWEERMRDARRELGREVCDYPEQLLQSRPYRYPEYDQDNDLDDYGLDDDEDDSDEDDDDEDECDDDSDDDDEDSYW